MHEPGVPIIHVIILAMSIVGSWDASATPSSMSFANPKNGDVFNIDTDSTMVTVKMDNVIEGTSLGFFLHKNIPEADKSSMPGPEGIIFAYSTESASHHTTMWNFKTLACVTPEGPKECSAALAPGPYRIEAIMYKYRKLPLVGPQAPKPTDVSARVFSGEFRLVSNTSLRDPLHPLLDKAAQYKFLKRIEAEAFPEIDLQYLINHGQDVKVGKDGKKCKKYLLTPPFVGSILACVQPESSEVQVGSDAGYAPHVLPYPEAKKIAQAAIVKKYGERVDFVEKPLADQMKDPTVAKQATYLDMSLAGWRYHQWWSFAFRVLKKNGPANTKDRFDDLVIVVVGNEKWNCIYHTAPFKVGSTVDLSTDGCSRFFPKS